LRFLTRFRRRAEAERPKAEGPPPTILANLPDGGNPIHRWIDGLRLPRHEPRRDVERRLGHRPDPFTGWNGLAFDEAATLPGAMAPWSARADPGIPPQVPVTRFSALTWFEDDAPANLRRTADHLASRLGPVRIGRQWNTLVATWRSGIAEIGLIVWPPEWQSRDRPNAAQDREPRLRTACHVTVATGFRLPLGEAERRWVAGFRPVRFEGAVGTARMAKAGTTAPGDMELEYARDPEAFAAAWQGSLGLSAGDEALIVVADQLFVVPRENVLGLEVIRLTPAKGGGGSSLHARCRTQAEGRDAQTLFLAQAFDPDGMNQLGRDRADRLGCPLDIAPYSPDV
jgi:hypothetical protein